MKWLESTHRFAASANMTPYSAATRARLGGKYGAFFHKRYDAQDHSLDSFARVVLEQVYSPINFRDGVRDSANFIDSHLCVLDIDDPPYSLAEALNDWADSACLIGLSYSHRKEKHGIVWDRFRIVTPWERPITCSYEYERNVLPLIERYLADDRCGDAAHFFYPCTEIVLSNLAGWAQPVKEFKRPEQVHVAYEPQPYPPGAMPKWIGRFVRDGVMPDWPELQGSRKWVCHRAARRLRYMGWLREDTARLLHTAKFLRAEFDPEEIDAAVKSAYKRPLKECRNEAGDELRIIRGGKEDSQKGAAGARDRQSGA